MFHEVPCEDFDCFECYWDMIGDLKEIFRQGDNAYNLFCNHLDKEMLWDSIRIIDGTIYFHRYTQTYKLGCWRSIMYYMNSAGKPNAIT